MNTAEIQKQIAKKIKELNELQGLLEKTSLEEASTEIVEDAKPDDELSRFYDTAKEKILHAYRAEKVDITKESVDKVACVICIKAREFGVRFPLYLPETNPLQHPLLLHLQEKHGLIPPEHQKGWKNKGNAHSSFNFPETSVNQHLTNNLKDRPCQTCKYCHKKRVGSHGTMEECLDRTLKAVLGDIINRVVRANEYLFFCKYCGDGFLTKQSMKCHMRKCLTVITLQGENGRLCAVCLEIKDITMFGKNNKFEDGLQRSCQDCINKNITRKKRSK